jgi:type II secretory pathway component PulF
VITRISNRDLGLLCERVGVAFDVGHDPFRIFEREAGTARSQHGRHMRSVADRIRQGASLTEAIREQGNYFPPNFHRLIEVGEESGRLEYVLDRMADHYKQVAELQDQFRGSIVWPLIQLGLALAVVSILIYVPSVMVTKWRWYNSSKVLGNLPNKRFLVFGGNKSSFMLWGKVSPGKPKIEKEI